MKNLPTSFLLTLLATSLCLFSGTSYASEVPHTTVVIEVPYGNNGGVFGCTYQVYDVDAKEFNSLTGTAAAIQNNTFASLADACKAKADASLKHKNAINQGTIKNSTHIVVPTR